MRQRSKPGASASDLKYILTGGYIPALSEVLPSIERAGLLVCDIEILRLHYAATLKAWRERFRSEIYFPGRLYPCALRGPAFDRARRTARMRHRDPAAALCGNAQSLARALPI